MHSITIISSVDKKGINQIHTYISTSDLMDYNVRCMIKIHTANRTAVNPTAFRSVPFQDVIQKQF